MYEAFDDQNSDGMKHLRSLAASGLKAVHILPSFHFASVNEDKSTWIIPTGLAQYPPDGTAAAGRRHRQPVEPRL
jgi:pullulanase